MKYIGKTIDFNKYTYEGRMSKSVSEYIAKTPRNMDNRKNHNKFYLKKLMWTEDTNISEFLGFLLAKRSVLKVCDVDLYKAPLKSGKFEKGVISYEEKSEKDKIVLPKNILNEFFEYQHMSKSIFNGADIDTIMNAMFFYINKNRRPYQEFLDFKQDFINMVVYDLKYLNPDRKLDNWLVRKNMQTGQLDLYPMFDNEMILGFDDDLKDEVLSEEKINLEDSKRTSAILTPQDAIQEKSESDYKTLMEYLLKKYPVQTQKALKQVHTVTSEDLENMLSNIEDVRETRVKRSVELFKKREQELDQIYERYKQKVR